LTPGGGNRLQVSRLVQAASSAKSVLIWLFFVILPETGDLSRIRVSRLVACG
jgi:hypothetical protein